MATTRKRSPGFTPEPETKEAAVAEFPEETATETLEAATQKEETVEESKPVEAPFVVESITPTEDPGPRFVPEPKPTPVAKDPEPPKLVAPRRHPRNIPKFSHHKSQ
jgi:hypothetical protein